MTAINIGILSWPPYRPKSEVYTPQFRRRASPSFHMVVLYLWASRALAYKIRGPRFHGMWFNTLACAPRREKPLALGCLAKSSFRATYTSSPTLGPWVFCCVVSTLLSKNFKTVFKQWLMVTYHLTCNTVNSLLQTPLSHRNLPFFSHFTVPNLLTRQTPL